MYRVIRPFALFMFLISAICFGAGVSSAQTPGGKTLSGITGVAVSGEEVSSEAVQDGLNKSALVTDTIQFLKSSGVNVLTDQELNSAPGRPTLVISVNTLKHAGGVYSYTVSLSLDQIVTLERNPGIRGSAPTWFVLATGACLPEELNADVGAYVRELAQQFVTDYKLANPEQASSKNTRDAVKKK